MNQARHLTRPIILSIALLLAAPHRAVKAEARDARLSLREVRERILRLITEPRFAHSTWGIQVCSLPSGATVFATNEHRLLQPASTAKLFAAAYALDTLGPDYRIRTPLLGSSPPNRSGTLRGDLVIAGRGDFSWAARFHGGDYLKSLDNVVAAIRAAGIRQVQGDLVGDASWIQGPPWGTGWSWDDLAAYYGAEVSALALEDNALDLIIMPAPRAGEPCRVESKPATDYLKIVNRTRTSSQDGPRQIEVYRPPGSTNVFLSGQLPVGSSNWVDAVSVPRPALWFLHLLRQRLKQEDIGVRGKLRVLDWPENAPFGAGDYRVLGTVDSPPLRELLARMLKPSQNQYAQLLLLQAGAHQEAATRRGPTGSISEQAALGGMRVFLASFLTNLADVSLDEGSGLSRTTRITPSAEVALLSHMSRHSQAKAFLDALPIAGKDGTLAGRMQGTAAEGRVRAKTGTLRGIHALAGYVDPARGERLVFAAIVNQHPAPSSFQARKDLDAIAILLASLEEAPKLSATGESR